MDKFHYDGKKTYLNDTKEANGALGEESSIIHGVKDTVLNNNKVENQLFYIIISDIIILLLIRTISFTP